MRKPWLQVGLVPKSRLRVSAVFLAGGNDLSDQRLLRDGCSDGQRTSWPSPSATCVAMAYEVDRRCLLDCRAGIARAQPTYPSYSPAPFYFPDGMVSRILHW